ncbi:MAG: glycoside hydrolase family 16 protein [Gammaproteobacteria bacterium]|nr:glycoside hydrolase family 16 protein [Gammaproteobacteria bacterium]
MTLRSCCLISTLLILGATTPAGANCTAGDCVLVWADEFEGVALDTGKWEPMIGNGSAYGLSGWGNNELQYYRSENAVVADGVLTITAREENFGGYGYTSARLRTLNLGDWKYGRFEMRARLPVTQGMWPAFWMLPTASNYGTWAASGEIDIMESLGHEPESIHGTIHYGGPFPENVSSGNQYFLPPGSATDFHVYAIEWEEGEIRWYVDGTLYSTRTQWYSTAGPYPAPFDQDFHLLLNLAVGGNFPGDPDASTVLPQDFIIDYVRVYQLPENVTPPERIFDDMEHGNPFANGWFSFNSSIGGGGLDGNFSDLPPANGGAASLQTGWGSGGQPGYFGGFGRTNRVQISDEFSEFQFWINPDPDQNYRLEINLQEDENADGEFNPANDEEFQFDCNISPAGPCAIAGGGWQLVTVPLTEFFDDNSYATGGNGILDAISPASGGNGELIQIVVTVISNSGAAATFRTDYWSFHGLLVDSDTDGIADIADNCSEINNPDQIDTNGDNIGNACDPDLDNDCDVDFFDVSNMKTVFLTNTPDADLDNDDFVGFLDLAIMKAFFLGPPGPSGLPNDCTEVNP